jgi:class 3 adenylate cyclase
VTAALPSGTVTFLFTDVEGSTRLWEKHPDAMLEALGRHDEIVRSAIEARGGYVFSTAGDSFAAAFARAGDAVRAAIDAQRALAAEQWATETPVRVRIGLCIGEAQERGGD